MSCTDARRSMNATYTIFTEDGETNHSRSVHVRVEKTMWEFTYRWFNWIIFAEQQSEQIKTTIPIGLQENQIQHHKHRITIEIAQSHLILNYKSNDLTITCTVE